MTEPTARAAPRWCVIGRVSEGRVGAVDLDATSEIGGRGAAPIEFPRSDFPEFVREREAEASPRWVWSDTEAWLPGLLEADVRIERCHDLRLSHAILRSSELVADRALLLSAQEWQRGPLEPDRDPSESALFALDATDRSRDAVPHDLDAALAEFRRQREAIAGSESDSRQRLGLLIAAESAGALAAVEMRVAGLPWDVEEHDRILREALGPRPAPGTKPARMVELAAEVSGVLGHRDLSIDSAPKLLASLRAAGIEVRSTSQWELAEQGHPAIAPLLQYKKLARLLSANGWSWIDEWVRDGRYRPVYIPGGVVTGRWASSGGGALQIPRLLRPVIHADPGWTLVSADVAQLEPRVLAAVSGDSAMAAAGRGRDMYAGIVDSGVVATRQEAKIAVLGAMYGSTTGDSGRLVPRLRRSFPRAMRWVDDAAATGERGGRVSTWLGRSSPAPDPEWAEIQARAHRIEATAADEARARRAARDFGRFTRNFVVQGTAAEWALAWIADLRLRLGLFTEVDRAPAQRSGDVFARRAHLAFFLHDEVIVHTPIDQAVAAAEAVRESAAAAGRLLFRDSPVDFPLDIRVSERAEKG